MAELTVHQLEANARTLVSLVQGLRAGMDREARHRAKPRLINEVLLKVWGGMPGQSRVQGRPPTPTDLNALQVLGVILKHDPPRFLRRR